MTELAEPRHRLQRRRARAAGGDGAQPARRLASLVERDRVLLRRVPLRVLLSPLARQLARLWRPKHVDPSADARHARDARARRRRGAPAARACATTAASRRPAWRVKGALALVALLAAVVAADRRVVDAGLRPDRRRRTRASTSAGRACWRCSSSASPTGSRRRSRPRSATADRITGAAGGARVGRRGPDRARHRRPALARAAGARGGVVLRAVPRRDRRRHLVRPLRL